MQTIGSGSGIFGSIKAKDLSRAGQRIGVDLKLKPTSEDGYEDRPVTTVRGVIAKRLLQSKQVSACNTPSPHFLLAIHICILKYCRPYHIIT